MNTVFFRVDASTNQGEGHFRRCLTLAQSLTFNVRIVFCCASLTPATKILLDQSNFGLIKLFTDKSLQKEQLITLINESLLPSILVIDNYNIEKKWEYEIQIATKSVIVIIDDLANRPHHCDLLIDSNYFRESKDYFPLVNEGSEILCGVNYLIFSENILKNKYKLQNNITKKNKNTTHVFFGATDPYASSANIALQIQKHQQQKVFVSLTKSTSQLFEQTQKLINITDIVISTDELEFSNIMSTCEFAIGAPGISLWERLILGCKTGCFATSENQIEILEHLHDEGICCYLGSIHHMSEREINESINYFYTQGVKKIDFNRLTQNFDTQGINLITKKIMNFLPELQTIHLNNTSLHSYYPKHINNTIDWLSASKLQNTFGFSKTITSESHKIWLRQQHNFYLWAIYNAKEYVGNLSIRINFEKKIGYLEIYLGDEKTKGLGIGRKSMTMIIEWSFNIMKLKKIKLITIEGNLRAEKLYKNCGFIFTEIKKNSQIIDGEYVNHNHWHLLREMKNRI
jgi:UDP-2,4-diacetamido-2,4,6-trideoxy-beta-L-altropyranose hydrolase